MNGRYELAELKLLDIEDVAELLSVSVRTVRRLISDQELKTIKVKNCTRVTPLALKDYIEHQTTKGG